VVDHVEGDRHEEDPEPDLLQPQRRAVHRAPRPAVRDHEGDDQRRAGGVEQVRRSEVVAQPLEVP
jgi:hypothetical protein